MKSVTLKQRNPSTGRWATNKPYDYDELQELVYEMNPGYFNHWLLGRIRRNAVDIVFNSLFKLCESG
jgi:hypothetical protein